MSKLTFCESSTNKSYINKLLVHFLKMNIDWKSITQENIEDLRPISWAYCQALINLKLWDKYCEALYDDSLTNHIVGTLLKSSVRKNILKNMEE